MSLIGANIQVDVVGAAVDVSRLCLSAHFSVLLILQTDQQHKAVMKWTELMDGRAVHLATREKKKLDQSYSRLFSDRKLSFQLIFGPRPVRFVPLLP